MKLPAALIVLFPLVLLDLALSDKVFPIGPDRDKDLVSKKDKRHVVTEEDLSEFHQWQEFKEFQAYKARKLKRARMNHKKKSHRRLDPPPIEEAALMARYIVNQAAWTSVATLSARKETESYPFVNIISFSDGPVGNGSGVPYLFLTPLDFTAQDLEKDNRATLMMTLAQGHYCAVKNYDPMDPRCARVVMTGKIRAILDDNPEIEFARNAVFGRHPWLAKMPEDHRFFFAKLKIATIAVLDTFGGPKYVTPKNYFHPTSMDIHSLKKIDSVELTARDNLVVQ